MKLLVLAALFGFAVAELTVSITENDGVVKYEVFNSGRQAVSFLTHNTPFEIFNDVMVGNPLSVQYIGAEGPFEVQYLGVMVRRQDIPPTAKDIMEIPAGQSISTVMDLGASYEMSVKGKYIVAARDSDSYSFAGVLIHVVEEGADEFPPTTLIDEPYYDVNMTEMKNCGRPTLVQRCTAGQTSQGNEAYRLSTVALPQLAVYNNPNPGDALSTRWFGSGGTGLANIQAGFQRMQQLLCQQGSFGVGSRFNCDNSCNYLAYVYPGDSTFTIYVCPPHFNTQMVGYTSQTGSIVHEASHFNPIMGSRDVVYGCSGSQNLARNNPTSARSNADNICYMVEFGGILGPVPNVC